MPFLYRAEVINTKMGFDSRASEVKFQRSKLLCKVLRQTKNDMIWEKGVRSV